MVVGVWLEFDDVGLLALNYFDQHISKMYYIMCEFGTYI